MIFGASSKCEGSQLNSPIVKTHRADLRFASLNNICITETIALYEELLRVKLLLIPTFSYTDKDIKSAARISSPG